MAAALDGQKASGWWSSENGWSDGLDQSKIILAKNGVIL